MEYLSSLQNHKLTFSLSVKMLSIYCEEHISASDTPQGSFPTEERGRVVGRKDGVNGKKRRIKGHNRREPEGNRAFLTLSFLIIPPSLYLSTCFAFAIACSPSLLSSFPLDRSPHVVFFIFIDGLVKAIGIKVHRHVDTQIGWNHE